MSKSVDPKKLAVGRRIAKARQELQMSQQALGRLVGRSASAVTQWETGLTSPTMENFQKLSSALSKPVQWLMEGKGEDASDWRAANDQELKMLHLFRSLPPSKKEALHEELELLRLIRSLPDGKRADAVRILAALSTPNAA